MDSFKFIFLSQGQLEGLNFKRFLLGVDHLIIDAGAGGGGGGGGRGGGLHVICHLSYVLL